MPKLNQSDASDLNTINTTSLTWKKAWFSSPGPVSNRDYALLFVKGIAMGTADIIPGVSGGTIAFITGIYSSLLNSISSIKIKLIWQLLSLQLKKALAEIHLRFLLTLLFGIALAIISTARVTHYLLTTFPVLTWSLFFGLITASIIVMGRNIHRWSTGFPALFLGALMAYGITGFMPVHTPETFGFIFFSGMIAISAMILPGLSGAFILLILGKYAFITAALRNPFVYENFEILLLFVSGCLVGILGFSRVLKYCLQRWHNITIALLTGIMIGAMRKVWPWKIIIESEIIRGKEHVLREENIYPVFNTEFGLAVLLMLVGFIMVLYMDKLSGNSTADAK